jgi:CheY-like chemotaxis protein
MSNVKVGGDSARLLQGMQEVGPVGQAEQTAIVIPKLSGEILLAEDNLMNQQLLQRMLAKTGARVTIADNGEIAVQLVLSKKFDLILMDMQMPVMSGLDAVRQLRGHNWQVPIVMLTANATLEDRTQCNEAGSNDFLTKPINRIHLYNIARKYLSEN